MERMQVNFDQEKVANAKDFLRGNGFEESTFYKAVNGVVGILRKSGYAAEVSSAGITLKADSINRDYVSRVVSSIGLI